MAQHSTTSFKFSTYSKRSDLPYEFKKAIKPSLERACHASQDFGSSDFMANGCYYTAFEDIPLSIIRSTECRVYECSFMNDDFIVHEIQSAEKIQMHLNKQAPPQSEKSS